MIKTILCSLLFVSFYTAQGQKILSYDWKEVPVRAQLTESELKEPEVTVKLYHEMEYFFTPQSGIGKLDLVHKIIRLNNDEGIENNNKVYLPTNNLLDLKVNMARIIYEDGTTRELEEEDIKEVKDKEGNVSVLYYAIEGLTKGVDLEVIYGRMYRDGLSGERITVQEDYTIKKAEYVIKVPYFLDLKFKSYNGLEEFKKEKEGGNNVYKLTLENIEPLEKEKFSNYKSNKKSFLYKLTKNNQSGRSLYQYVDKNESFYKSYYDNDIKEKAILTYTNEIGLKDLSIEEKVIKIERYIKNNIDVLNDAPGDIKTILKENKASYNGIIRLYAEIFETLEIKHKLVNTSDRFTKGNFDEEYESYYYLEDLLFYIDKTKKLLNPVDFTGRYPYVDEGFLANKGLFFSLIKVGKITSLISNVREIETLEKDANYQNFNATIDFNDFENIRLVIKVENFGYFGNETQEFYRFYGEDEHKETANGYLKVMDENAEVETYELKNTTSDDIGVNPLIVTGTVKTDKLMGFAGNNYLFKIGKVIGTQQDLYDKNKRNSDIDLAYLNTINRKIEFTIPEGYSIKNLKDLNLFAEDSLKTLGFSSSFVKEGSVVSVIIKEYYNQIFYDQSHYDEFRKVINTVADFNKVTLLLEKL